MVMEILYSVYGMVADVARKYVGDSYAFDGVNYDVGGRHGAEDGGLVGVAMGGNNDGKLKPKQDKGKNKPNDRTGSGNFTVNGKGKIRKKRLGSRK